MASVEVLCCPHTPRLRLLWLDDSRGWLVGWLVEVQSFSLRQSVTRSRLAESELTHLDTQIPNDTHTHTFSVPRSVGPKCRYISRHHRASPSRARRTRADCHRARVRWRARQP
jgi:hypothetical protein